MTAPQPEVKGSNRNLILILIGVGVLILCVVAIVCLGPLVFFAWFSDRQMDELEQDAPMLIARLLA